jgi:hypothetical protein
LRDLANSPLADNIVFQERGKTQMTTTMAAFNLSF